jgi:DNA repair ATPase RecN
MDANFVSETLFWIVTASMGGLMSIVGYLVKLSISKNEKEMVLMKTDIKENRDLLDNRFSNMLEKLDKSINALNAIVSEMKEVNSVVKTEHGEQIKEIKRRIENKTKWLEDHDKELNGLDKRLTMVESDCKHYHKKGA